MSVQVANCLLTPSGLPLRKWFDDEDVGGYYVQYLCGKNIMNCVGMTNTFRSLCFYMLITTPRGFKFSSK